MRPLILVTNDDGINAPGIAALISVARELGEVVVVAPDSPQSAQGHAITVAGPLRIKQVDPFDGLEAYECSGTPVDCVKLAKQVILKDRTFDFCVSGINHGSNSATNILYSGTMSAAMEASLEGVDSIGFSLLDYEWEADFGPSLPYVRQIMQDMVENGLSETKLLNVNIPHLPADQIKGIKVCRQAEARWVEAYQAMEDPRGKMMYWLTGEFRNDDQGTDTDVYALENGYVSVVPSGHDLTKYEAIEPMRRLEKTATDV